MTIPQLRNEINNGTLKNLYLFYGPEDYLIKKYTALIKEKALPDDLFGFNLHRLEDEKSLADLREIADQYPQAASRRLIIAKGTGFLSSDAKEKREFLKNIPNYLVLLFIEKDSKKLSRPLIKIIEEAGAVVHFETQQPSDLRAWAAREFSSANKKIRQADLDYLVQSCEFSLSKMELEIAKILAASGNSDEIKTSIITDLLQKPLDFKVFDFVDALLSRRAPLAYEMIRDFKSRKEEPIVLISLIFTQLYYITMVKTLRDDAQPIDTFFPPNRKFLAKKIAKDCNKYDIAFLRQIMNDCATYDLSIKNGQIDSWTALELITAQLLQ